MKKYEPPKILNISDTFHGKWTALALTITRFKEENKKVYIPIFESIIKRIKRTIKYGIRRKAK